MKTFLFILTGVALILPGELSAQQTHRPSPADTNQIVVPKPPAFALRPEAARARASYPLIYPVNPPRSADGRAIETDSTNFVFMYPVNPPRVVKLPARGSIILPGHSVGPKAR